MILALGGFKKEERNVSKKHKHSNYAVETNEEIEPVEEAVEIAEKKIEPITGMVDYCAKLNVRTTPDLDGDVIASLAKQTEVEIDLSKSTDDWYYICTAIGVEGFCMRQYVYIYL